MIHFEKKGIFPARDSSWLLMDSDIPPKCVPIDRDVQILKTVKNVYYVRTPEFRFSDLPEFGFRSNYVFIDGLRTHYVDEGPPNGEVILLLHGQPTWSFLYRKIIPRLANNGYRVIAVDLIGMGKSDKPIELGFHTYEQHVQWLSGFISALRINDITLFCQDWGGAIGLRIVGDRPEIFSRVVAANTSLPFRKKGTNPFRIVSPVRIDYSHKDFDFRKGAWFSFLPTFIQDLVNVRKFQSWINYALTTPNLIPSRIVNKGIMSSLSNKEALAYDSPYPSFIYKAAIRAFPSMTASIEEQNRGAWSRLMKFDKPFLSLAGIHDDVMGDERLQKHFINNIPGARGQPHERFIANHFIQEDIGDTLSCVIDKFIKDNPA